MKPKSNHPWRKGYKAKKIVKRFSMRKLESVHYKEGVKRYGKKRFDGANFGWYADDRSIASKVYGDPIAILTSTWESNGDIQHFEEEY